MQIMSEQMLEDVRAAKKWVDQQAGSMHELAERLRQVEVDFAARVGEFATVAATRSAKVQQAIDTAADKPGDSLLSEARELRTR
jgi:hypothetical protein